MTAIKYPPSAEATIIMARGRFGIQTLWGFPTVVYAQDLSVPAILDGIRSGHVFIDLTGSHDRMLEMTATPPDKDRS